MDYVKISKYFRRGVEPITKIIKGVAYKLYPLYKYYNKEEVYEIGLIDEVSSIKLFKDADADFKHVIIINSTIKLFENADITSSTIINSNIVSSGYFDFYGRVIQNSNINIE